MSLFNIKQACTPAKIYLFLSVTSIIIFLFYGFDLSFIIGNIFTYSLFALFLNWLCSVGYSSVSWAIVIIPFAITLSAVLYVSFNDQVQLLTHQNKNTPYLPRTTVIIG